MEAGFLCAVKRVCLEIDNFKRSKDPIFGVFLHLLLIFYCILTVCRETYTMISKTITKEEIPMLTVEHLTKKYGKVTACNDVNLHLDPGSVTVLLGPNGAGKSTLMKSIIGFLQYEGSITVAGCSNKSSQARSILGYIPEMPSLYPNLTVSEHMEFLARAYRLKDYRQRVDELFAKFELDDKRKKFGDELSKGMQQKLNICLGLLPEPRLLLLDEPMIGLDPHAIKELKASMEQMRAEGRTLLVSTHIIDSVDMLWDRALIMRDGVIHANLTRQELEEDGRTLEQLFFDVTEGGLEV